MGKSTVPATMGRGKSRRELRKVYGFLAGRGRLEEALSKNTIKGP
jgi:hypothetical protein